jgi:hypothetical protein
MGQRNVKRTSLALAACTSLVLAGTSVRLGGAIYPRYTADDMGSSFELMAAEAVVQAQVTGETKDIVSAVMQVYAGGVMSGWARGFHLGEAYVLLPLGLSLPTIRVGQAVVPFGLLADYDTHTQIIQTTYAKTLGLRLDPGVGVLGALGQWQYAVWLSNGNGPDRMDNDGNKLVTARVAPRFLWGDAELTLGLSGLAGSLPYWSLDSIASQVEGPRSYKRKYRLGLDNTTDWGPSTLRLEAVAGHDGSIDGAAVYGYYAEARYALVNWLEALTGVEGFHADGGQLSTASLGLNFYPPNVSALELQTLYQRGWSHMISLREGHWRLAAQLVVRF